MANKHTTGAAAGYAACVAVTRIAKLWWPDHSQQLDGTMAVLKDLAVMYGFAMAGDGNNANGHNGKDDTSKPDGTIMKKLTLILAIIGAALGLQAQTNTVVPPPSLLNFDFLTNLPLQTNFTKATFGFSIAPLLKNGFLENETKLDWYVKTNVALGFSGQFSPSATALDELSLHAGYRMAWPNADILFQGLGRRTFETDVAGTHPSWQGGVNLDANWVPMTGNKLMIGSGVKFLTSDHGKVLDRAPDFEWTPLKITLIF